METAPLQTAQIAAAEPALTEGMNTLQILSAYENGSVALNDADYYGAMAGNLSSPLYKAALMADGVDAAGDAYLLTTTPLENFTQSLKLAGTGLTPGAAFGAGVVGTGAKSVGWLGNTTATQSSTGK